MSVGKVSNVRFKFDFEEFYYYCEQYFLTYGELDVGGHCMAVKEKDGTVTFLKNVTPEEREKCTYDIGRKLQFVRDNYSKSKPSHPLISNLSESQIERLNKLAPGWEIPGQTSFNQFYSYCKIYYDRCGNLAIPLQYVMLKDDSDYYFKDYHEVTPEEKVYQIYSIGDKLKLYSRLYREGGNVKGHVTQEQCDTLSTLDPYWYYPRSKMGYRVDPVTKKSVDYFHADDSSQISYAKKKSLFDFDQFYSFALLYFAKYGCLCVNRRTVVIKNAEGQLDFVRREQLSTPNDIVYRFGTQFYKIIKPEKSGEQSGAKMLNKHYQMLTDEQYQKLTNLDPNWGVTSSESLNQSAKDPVTACWLREMGRPMETNYSSRKEVVKIVSSEADGEVSSDDESEDKEGCRRVTVANISDFELFYDLCKHQRDVTGSIQFSRSKVVTIKSDEQELEYPIGKLFRAACDTRYFDELKAAGKESEDLSFVLRLNDEQNRQMDELYPYWYYPLRIQNEIKIKEMQLKREERKKNLERI